MYRNSYEYKCYKEEYDAYENEKEDLIKGLEREEKIQMKNKNIEEKLKAAWEDLHRSFYALKISEEFLRMSSVDFARISKKEKSIDAWKEKHDFWYKKEKYWIQKNSEFAVANRRLKKAMSLLDELDKNHNYDGFCINDYEELRKDYYKFENTYLLLSVIEYQQLLKLSEFYPCVHGTVKKGVQNA